MHPPVGWHQDIPGGGSAAALHASRCIAGCRRRAHSTAFRRIPGSKHRPTAASAAGRIGRTAALRRAEGAQALQIALCVGGNQLRARRKLAHGVLCAARPTPSAARRRNSPPTSPGTAARWRQHPPRLSSLALPRAARSGTPLSPRGYPRRIVHERLRSEPGEPDWANSPVSTRSPARRPRSSSGCSPRRAHCASFSSRPAVAAPRPSPRKHSTHRHHRISAKRACAPRHSVLAEPRTSG